MNVHLLILAAGSLLLTACAATPSPSRTANLHQSYGDEAQLSSHIASRHPLSPAMTAAVEDAAARLLGEAPKAISVRDSVVARIAIGGRGPQAFANHEAAANLPGNAEKLSNDLGRADPGTLLQRTQNSRVDNGWRSGDNGYLHLHSGLVCPNALTLNIKNKESGATQTLVVPLNDIRLFNEQGLDTACDYLNEQVGVYYTFFVSKWPDRSLEDHFSGALRHIVDRFDIAAEAPLVSLDLETSGEGKNASTIESANTLTGAFILNPVEDGTVLKTALWLNKTGDWHVKARATFVVAPAGSPVPEEPTAPEILASVAHAVSLSTVDQHINRQGNGVVEVSF